MVRTSTFGLNKQHRVDVEGSGDICDDARSDVRANENQEDAAQDKNNEQQSQEEKI